MEECEHVLIMEDGVSFQKGAVVLRRTQYMDSDD